LSRNWCIKGEVELIGPNQIHMVLQGEITEYGNFYEDNQMNMVLLPRPWA